jgi:hypothetical protein
MGIANPRPSMRCREERDIREKLAHHAAMLKLILNAADGQIDPRVADHDAARLTQTRKARKTIWKTKRLRREFGPADVAKKLEGFADAARRVAQEEAAMAKPVTGKIH